jgi:hypothetical protein
MSKMFTQIAKTNMYKLSVKQWNPWCGCLHGCVYCPSSFQAQLKRWAKKKCCDCYTFKPHGHPERLNQSLPKTGYMQFIFALANGDVAFCPTLYLLGIIKRIEAEPDKWFLIQSKNPATFNRVKFPKNVILGSTIETNRDDLYEGISKAPLPSRRFEDFLRVNHPYKMVTCEPIIDFDVDVMLKWIEKINPVMIWIGYDSKKNYLPEPELEKVKALHWELAKRGFIVILKTIRPAWWEANELS